MVSFEYLKGTCTALGTAHDAGPSRGHVEQQHFGVVRGAGNAERAARCDFDAVAGRIASSKMLPNKVCR
jgi:hypothetical protein